MFIGRHQHTIDSKARVAVPHKFRAELGANDGRIVVTYSPTEHFRSLDLIPLDTWEIFLNELLAAPMEGPEAHEIREAILANYVHAAQEVVLDKQNRILIPSEHREYAGLTKDVVSSGDMRKVRLWNAAEYERFLGESSGKREKLKNIPGVWL